MEPRLIRLHEKKPRNSSKISIGACGDGCVESRRKIRSELNMWQWMCRVTKKDRIRIEHVAMDVWSHEER